MHDSEGAEIFFFRDHSSIIKYESYLYMYGEKTQTKTKKNVCSFKKKISPISVQLFIRRKRGKELAHSVKQAINGLLLKPSIRCSSISC